MQATLLSLGGVFNIHPWHRRLQEMPMCLCSFRNGNTCDNDFQCAGDVAVGNPAGAENS